MRLLARRPPRTTSGGRRSGWRRSCCALLELRKPDLDERPDALLETGLARDRERGLVALAHLVEGDTLLQPIVPGHQELLDPLAGVVGTGHDPEATAILAPRCSAFSRLGSRSRRSSRCSWRRSS